MDRSETPSKKSLFPVNRPLFNPFSTLLPYRLQQFPDKTCRISFDIIKVASLTPQENPPQGGAVKWWCGQVVVRVSGP
jgi:hypothetical protein